MKRALFVLSLTSLLASPALACDPFSGLNGCVAEKTDAPKPRENLLACDPTNPLSCPWIVNPAADTLKSVLG